MARQVHRDCRAGQLETLEWLLGQGKVTRYGHDYGFESIGSYDDFRNRVPVVEYPALRKMIMRMVDGESDVLWRGITRRFAQSSGTSDGKSKYIPLTNDSLRLSHYRGGTDTVALYLDLYRDSKLFSGKSFILGGSYATALDLKPGVKAGDLSAHLIDNINPLANLVRVPDKRVALMEDWNLKLPSLVEASMKENVTSISGVPSWFLTVLKEVVKRAGAEKIHDVWPNLEVFMHGGIAFGPYREEYNRICDPAKMHYLETYNASEGFFAVQDIREPGSMLLLLDVSTFYEFIPLDSLGDPFPDALGAWEVEPGKIYALAITSCNGLWRYLIGDTVRIESVNPLRISIAGRTRHFINAFGEELMVYNADAAIARCCSQTGVTVLNYTAAPIYASGKSRGRHQWLIEFSKPPESLDRFRDLLDRFLQEENSDYQAKRAGGIFLDAPEIIIASPGQFDRWLSSTGKLGGQRKIPRLSNDRKVIEAILNIEKNKHDNI